MFWNKNDVKSSKRELGVTKVLKSLNFFEIADLFSIDFDDVIEKYFPPKERKSVVCVCVELSGVELALTLRALTSEKLSTLIN